MDAPQAPTHRWLQQGAGWTLVLAGDWRGAAATACRPRRPRGFGALKVDAQGAGCVGRRPGRRVARPPGTAGPPGRDAAAGSAARRRARGAGTGLACAGQRIHHGTPAEPPLSGLAALGQWVIERSLEAASTAAFFGEVLLALGRLLRGRSGLRGGDCCARSTRPARCPSAIVALTCFLVGLMLAYMGGAQLDKLGAQAYIADIVTVGMVRELAGLMTGMILAGRVGAAFARSWPP
jgi:phospholipid/cholesterol/gamma-HCH transport system permease protein